MKAAGVDHYQQPLELLGNRPEEPVSEMGGGGGGGSGWGGVGERVWVGLLEEADGICQAKTLGREGSRPVQRLRDTMCQPGLKESAKQT